MIERDWFKCYGESWSGIIVPDAFAHPANFSRALIRRIYAHAFDRGWLVPGDTLVDPFGGVALGALEAMRRGLHWTGVELEQKFVGLGNQNIDLWNATYAAHLPGWGTARLVQGDSRELARIVGEVGAVVSSPPFNVGDSASAQSITARTDKSADWIKNNTGWKTGYGSSKGQLANLPEGDFAAAISSPPWSDIEAAHAGRKFKDPEGSAERRAAAYASGKLKGHAASKEAILAQLERENEYNYSTSPGQLGAMPAGEFAAAVSSPPFMENNVNIGAVGDTPVMRQQIHNASKRDRSYGLTPGQLGNDNADTFWSAARTIVSQTYQVLRPGAVAIWVTKAFVRNKARVDFPGQWLALCQSCGFEPLEWIRAWLVEDNGAQYTLDGNLERRIIKRASFFRRLAEKNGSPPIDYEVVLCTKKPELA